MNMCVYTIVYTWSSACESTREWARGNSSACGWWSSADAVLALSRVRASLPLWLNVNMAGCRNRRRSSGKCGATTTTATRKAATVAAAMLPPPPVLLWRWHHCSAAVLPPLLLPPLRLQLSWCVLHAARFTLDTAAHVHAHTLHTSEVHLTTWGNILLTLEVYFSM
jgi:hypothetical protein